MSDIFDTLNSDEDIFDTVASKQPDIFDTVAAVPEEHPLSEQYKAQPKAKSATKEIIKRMIPFGTVPDAAEAMRPSELYGSAFTKGVIRTEEAVGTALQYLGTRTGSETLTDVGKTTSKFWDEATKKYAPPTELQASVWDKPELLANADWWIWNVGEASPSLFVSIIPALGAGKYINMAGKALKFTPATVAKLAYLGSAVFGGLTGGALEGTGTYEEVVKRGGTPEEAALAAEKMWLASAAFNAISLGRILKVSPDAGVKQALLASATEGITEWLEEPTEAVILGDDIIKAMKDGLNVLGPAAILGLVAGGGFISRGSLEPTTRASEVVSESGKVYTPAKDIFDEVDTATQPDVFDTVAGDETVVAEKTVEPEQIAKDLDIIYNGIQEGYKDVAPSLYPFTDKVTGTTFAVKEADFNAQAVQKRLKEKRIEFGVEESVTSESTTKQHELEIGKAYLESYPKAAVDENGKPYIPDDAQISGLPLTEIQGLIAGGERSVLPFVEQAVKDYGANAAADALLNKPATIAIKNNTKAEWKKFAPEVEAIIDGTAVFESVEVAEAGKTQVNASIESDKSLEAINRAKTYNYAVVDSRSGKVREASEDYAVRPYEVKTQYNKDTGDVQVLDKGQSVTKDTTTESVKGFFVNRELPATIANTHNEFGGSSITQTGENIFGTPQFSVSTFKGLEHVVESDKLSAKDIESYKKKHQAVLKKHPNAFIGTWVDNGKSYLDISIAVGDFKEALTLAKEHNQLAVFNLEKGESVYLDSPEAKAVLGEGDVFDKVSGKAKIYKWSVFASKAQELKTSRAAKAHEVIFEVEGKEAKVVEAGAEVQPSEVDIMLGRLTKMLRSEAGFIEIQAAPSKSPHAFQDEEIEQRIQDSRGVKKPGLYWRTKDAMQSFGNKLTREFEHLPNTGEFAALRFALLNLQKQGDISADKAVHDLEQIVKDLSKGDYDLFWRKVYLDDALYTAAKAKREGKVVNDVLAHGFTEESLVKEKDSIDAKVVQNKAVNEAIEKRREVWNTRRDIYITAMEAIGFNVKERFLDESGDYNEDYFHHQILEYANLEIWLGSGALKTPVGEYFLKRRQGSIKDYNVDYLQAEYTVLSRMLYDTKVAKVIALVDKKYNIAKKVRQEYVGALEDTLMSIQGEEAVAELKAGMKENGIPPFQFENLLKSTLEELQPGVLERNGLSSWKDTIPEGYTFYQPREGNLFFHAYSISEQLVEQLHESAMGSVGLTEDMIKEIWALGGKRKEYVVKKEVSDTIEDLSKTHDTGLIARANNVIIQKWKVWTLISPRKWFKYNFRNMSGDAEAAFIGNPNSFSYVIPAFKELRNYVLRGGEPTEELEMWLDFGGMGSTLQATEITDINKLEKFLVLLERKYGLVSTPTGAVKTLWQKYWELARVSTDFREALMRYAAFKSYRAQMRANGGEPTNFGASIPEEIMGLSDTNQRAYWLANDLLGAYDRVSIVGQYLANRSYPFFRWKEVNFTRTIRLFRNALNDKKLMSAVGNKAVGTFAKSPLIAYRVGRFVAAASFLWAMTAVWNNVFFPDEEDELPEDEKGRPHIIFGRDINGNVMAFTRLGAVSDFFGTFGLDDLPQQVNEWFNGRRTIKEIAIDMAKAPVNTYVQGWTPTQKVPIELLTRQKFFPDAFNRSTVRDRQLHVADSLGVSDEYKAIVGLPSRPYHKSLSKAFIYKYDAGETAYRDVNELKQEYLEKLGKGREGYMLTEKGQLLYNLRLAVKFEDKEAAEKYFMQYMAQPGASRKRIQESMKALHPLSGLKGKEKREFEESLTPLDKKKMERALTYYEETLSWPKYRDIEKEWGLKKKE